MNDKLREALEKARKWHNGDKWRNGNAEERAAWEAHRDLLDEALAASKPEPQAQAEPEVVAWANSASLASASISRQRGGPFDQHTLGESKNSFHDTPLITLQSHREAIAKKDAALNACLEALGTCRIMSKDNDGNYTIEVTPKMITSAIKQAKDSLK